MKSKILSKEELDNKECKNCGRKGFRIVDKRNNKTICITCGFALQKENEAKDGN